MYSCFKVISKMLKHINIHNYKYLEAWTIAVLVTEQI